MTIVLSADNLKANDLEAALAKALSETEGLAGVTIILPCGEFLLKKTTLIQTPSISHDDGCEENEAKEVCIMLKDRPGFTLRGAVGEDGETKTVLLVHNDGKPQCLKSSAIWAENCPGLTLENLELRMSSPTSFFGTIEEKFEDTLVIKPGGKDYPVELPVYCMNRFRDGVLLGKSVTIGFGIDDTMKKREDGRFVLVSKEIADTVNVGEDLSWHLSGMTDFFVFIGHCDDLHLKNIRVSDASGFGMLTECCRNITARKVVIRSREGYQPVSRDGWKIFRCSGRIGVSDSWIEGTRMDGQNIHSNYLIVRKVAGNRIEAEMKYAPSLVTVGSYIQFQGTEAWEKPRILSWRIVSSEFRTTGQEGDGTAAKAVVGKKNRFTLYEFYLDEIPNGVSEGSYCILEDFTVEEYICSGSTFRNIAGGGNLIRARSALLERNSYENIMNAGVLIGAEWDTHAEAMNPENVEVRNCSFTNVGFSPRYGERGMGGVAAAAQGFGDEPVIGRLLVENCSFSSLSRAVELRNVRNAVIRGNTYSGVGERLFVEKVNRVEVEDYL